MRGAVLSLTVLFGLTLSAGAWPGPGVGAARFPGPTLKATPPMLAMGRSVGSPTAGHLVGGSKLPEAPYLRVVPAYANGEVKWGLGSLIGMIERAGKSVRKTYSDAVLSVGHISRHGGGEVDRHRSHESGRDADIGFFVRDVRGKPLLSDHFVPFHGDATAPSWPGAFFDDARNWTLVKAFLTDPEAHVSHIFVSAPLRARLLAYAAKSGAPQELRERAALTMVQPHGSLPHDDHFHVRISCPPSQRECVELPMKKKPALVAKVPVPQGRVRAHAGVANTAAAPAATEKTPKLLQDAASKVFTPPAARLSQPLELGAGKPSSEPEPAIPAPDAIDDVDGPM